MRGHGAKGHEKGGGVQYEGGEWEEAGTISGPIVKADRMGSRYGQKAEQKGSGYSRSEVLLFGRRRCPKERRDEEQRGV